MADTKLGKPKYDPSAIDAAIARAKEQAGTTPAAKAEKASTAKKEKATKEPKEPKEPKAPKPEKPSKGPAHLNKVEKASANLPVLSAAAQAAFDHIKDHPAGYTAGELSAIAAHLGYKARLMMTAGAVGAKPTKGALVEILPGDKGSEKYVGFRGRLTEVRSIRCFADIFGIDGETVVKKGLYLFTSGVKVIEEPEATEEAASIPGIVHDQGPEPEDATEPKEFPADPPKEVQPADEAPAETDADEAPAETDADEAGILTSNALTDAEEQAEPAATGTEG